MDFFEHQETARRNSHVLVFYFVLAVAGIILAVYLLVNVLSFLLRVQIDPGSGSFELWRPDLLAVSSGSAGLVIFLASAYKSMQLNGGGKVVAHELGGRHLNPHSTDFYERRLLNVVEEMAIASGVPVPEVYVMDSEDAINAFAAGKTTSDAVIGVTRGCMKMLNREELQGVVAHEFSHILNGDMRLNLRLIGMLFGILFLTLIGEVLLRSTYYSGRGSRSRGSGGIVLAMLLAGVGLLAIGYVGMFFANLIKASISRQREFLADASAVQFTRNPDGIAGALKKIGALSKGSKIAHPMARDASHLFFGSALSRNAFATHPPLEERIRRLLPHWDGDFGSVKVLPQSEVESELRSKPKKSKRGGDNLPGVFLPGVLLAGRDASVRLTEEEAAESMRSVHSEQVNLGHEILTHLPDHWLESVRSERGALAIILTLLLSQDDKLRTQELRQVSRSVDSETFQIATSLYDELKDLHSAVKLALIDLAIPALRRLSPSDYVRFRDIMNGLVVSDESVDLFEFTLGKVVERHLDVYFQFRKPPAIRHHQLESLSREAAILLSALAVMSRARDEGESGIRAAFANGSDHFQSVTGRPLEFQPGKNCSLQSIKEAIERFEESTPLMKRELLLACSKTVLTDGQISSEEAELIRAIADAMGCSIPPFVKTAPLSIAPVHA